MSDRTIAIVGAGLAGAIAARALRDGGFEGRIALFGEETHAPYERPKLSKEYLRGEVRADSLAVLSPDEYERLRIDLVAGTAVAGLHLADRRLVLRDGRSYGYDGLLVATGAAAIRPSIQGAGLPGVHTLRTFEDADRLRVAAATASRAIVVGGGWIAAETAASLRQLGLDVTLVVPGAVPLERSLGETVAAVYADLHRRHGVRIVSRSRVVAILGRRHATGVQLDTGRVLQGSAVVLGVGAAARIELAAAAGIEVGDGILVDESLATSAPGVYAAGDVAAAWNPRFGARLRSEHWDNAIGQGQAAASSLLGRRVVHDAVPYVYSDQFELGMEYVGLRHAQDRVAFRPVGDGFVAFWLRHGRATAGMQANAWDLMPAVRSIVESGARLDPDRVADPDVPLEDVAEPDLAVA